MTTGHNMLVALWELAHSPLIAPFIIGFLLCLLWIIACEVTRATYRVVDWARRSRHDSTALQFPLSRRIE